MVSVWKKFIFLIITQSVIIYFSGFAFAQKGQVTGSGTVTCTFTGRTQIKTISLDDNKFLLLKDSDTNKIKASLITANSNPNTVVLVASLGNISDTNSLLGGTPFSFMNNDSAFEIRTTKNSTGLVKSVISIPPNASSGTITITNHENNTVNGKLKLIFKNTRSQIFKNSKLIRVNKNNKRVSVDCDFINIPISDKEAVECNSSEEDCI